MERRDFLTGVAGLATAVGGAGVGRVAAASGELTADPGIERARYLRKYAVERAKLYESMLPVFQPPDTDDFYDVFGESLQPTAGTLLPVIAGDALDSIGDLF